MIKCSHIRGVEFVDLISMKIFGYFFLLISRNRCVNFAGKMICVFMPIFRSKISISA
jgi:hypothetical protein